MAEADINVRQKLSAAVPNFATKPGSVRAACKGRDVANLGCLIVNSKLPMVDTAIRIDFGI